MARHRLIHTGNAIVDLVLPVEAIPPRGGDTFASGAEVTPGGGFNVAAAAARQGMNVLYAGLTGTGPFGQIVREALIAEGIEILHPPHPSLDNGISVVAVEADGERTFISTAGAEAHWGPSHLDGLALRAGDTLYITAYSLAHRTNAAILAAAMADIPAEVRVVLDLCPVIDRVLGEEFEAVLARADWVCGNRREAAVVTQIDDPCESAKALAARARQAGLVRVGPDGCWLSLKDGGLEDGQGGPPLPIPGFPVVATDLTGAGDAHVGVLIAALASGMLPAAAARRANAAAAMTVTRRGPATSPGPRDLDAFLHHGSPA